ncbi:cupredoxin domain-containing protein [Petropleomorpha daqingensis]|uniref:Plastocyanin n=1 Tax=Petropleomorpha daqingensis TaxID=2026353 RepID=A0A853CDL4_9ACTN|nr:cupredoxin domain-containing protein [Petropleomorpha daqingensis]NYJ06105.1 plastocyanin [Petropleomorpha daqingensis]
MRRAVVACVCAVFLTTGTACGSGPDSNGATGSSAGAAAATITIKDFKYTTPTSVAPGVTINVNNEDSIAHTVTADSGNAFDDQANSGASSFTAPSKAGSYPFHCTFHPEMHGTLVVK